MNLLMDLAQKNRLMNRDSDSTESSVQSNAASPHRLRRGGNNHNSSNTTSISQDMSKNGSKSEHDKATNRNWVTEFLFFFRLQITRAMLWRVNRRRWVPNRNR